jgi:hypothetical protein
MYNNVTREQPDTARGTGARGFGWRSSAGMLERVLPEAPLEAVLRKKD